METVHKIESTLAEWYKNMPHFPHNVQQWLGKNMWWLVLIGVVLGGIGVISFIILAFFAGAILAGVGGPVGAVLGGAAMIAAIFVVLFSSISIVIAGIAIAPLKDMQKKGWTLLFIVLLLNVAMAVIGFLLSLNIFDLVWNMLVVAVGGYFLFEIRSFFKSPVAPRKAATPSKAK